MPPRSSAGNDPARAPDSEGARFAALMLGATGVLLVAAIAHAATAGAAPLLGPLGLFVEAAIAAGGGLERALAALPAGSRWLAMAVAVVPLALPAARGPVSLLASAFVLAGVAQACLLDGQPWIGGTLYAAAAVVYATRASEHGVPRGRLPLWLELPTTVALIALFIVLALYRLDVQPHLHVDEVGYHTAARTSLGQIDGDEIRLGAHTARAERYRAQAIPHGLQSAAIAALGTGILSIRLVSLVCMTLALAAAALALRRRLGARTTLWMLALAASAPLALAHARPGVQIATAVLHGVLCFGALLAFRERGSVVWAVILGALLGSSLYHYQLAWFAPVFGAAWWLLPGTPRVLPGWRRAALVGAVAAAIALPGVLAFGGLRDVADDTLAKSPLAGREGAIVTAVVEPPAGTTPDAIREVADHLQSPGLRTQARRDGTRVTGIVLQGGAPRVRLAIAWLESASWELRFASEKSPYLRVRLASMLARLVRAPGDEHYQSFVSAPLLNPLLVPLLALGLVACARRWREPALRLLLLWVVAGALVPALFGDAQPRRALLVFPFAWAVVALPVVELADALRARGAWGRAAARALALALAATATASGAHLYYRHWDVGVLETNVPHVLALEKILLVLPPGEPVLMPRLVTDPSFGRHLERLHADGRHIVELRGRAAPERVRALSCRETPPFSWLTLDSVPTRRALHILERDFRVDVEPHAPYLLHRVRARRPGACAATPGSASPSAL